MILMNKASRWLGSFVAVSLFIRLVVNASALAQDAPQTPEPNRPEIFPHQMSQDTTDK